MDPLDQLLSQQAVGNQTDPLGAALSSQAFPQPTPNNGIGDRIAYQAQKFSGNLGSGLDAAAQLLYHSLPQSIRDAGDRLNNSIANITGAFPVIPPGGLDAKINADQQGYDAWRQAHGDTGRDYAGIAGKLGAGVVAGAALPAEAGMGAVAAGGALVNALTSPVQGGDYWTEKAKQLGLGAVGGAAGKVVGDAFGSVIAPTVRDDVKKLIDMGITPTPGQIAGGALGRAEEGAMSIPGLGDTIRNARIRTNEQFNNAVINQAISPIGASIPKGQIGREALENAYTKIGQKYDQIIQNIGAAPVDSKFLGDLSGLKSLTANMPKGMSDQFDSILKNEIGSRIDARSGTITGEGIKAAESNLGNIARGYMRSSDYDQQQLGTAVVEAQNTVRNWLGRVSPQNAADLASVNQAYANLMRPMRAAGYQQNESGVFTPNQLQSAVKALDPSKNGRNFAMGRALMQDVSEPAKNVLGSKVPDSGTPFRSMIGVGAAGLAGHSVFPEGVSEAAPWVAGGLGVMAVPYTTFGQKLAAAIMTKRPEAATSAAELARYLSPYAGIEATQAIGQSR